MCFRIPLDFSKTFSALSLSTHVDQQRYVCCLPLGPCAGEGPGQCPVACRQPLPHSTEVTVSLYLLSALVTYAAFFLVPVPALWIQNLLEESCRQSVTEKSSAIRGTAKGLNRNLQMGGVAWTAIVTLVVASLFMFWTIGGVFFIVPDTVTKHHTFSRTCKAGELPWVVGSFAIILLLIMLVSRLVPIAMCYPKTKAAERDNVAGHLCYELRAIPFILTIIFILPIVYLIRDIWDSKKIKNIRCDSALDVMHVIFNVLELPIIVIEYTARILVAVPAIHFFQVSWEHMTVIALSICNDKNKNPLLVKLNSLLKSTNVLKTNLRLLLVGIFIFCAACVMWMTWVATYDTMSFVFFTFISYFSVDTATTVYVTGAIVGLLGEIVRRMMQIDNSLISLDESVLGFDMREEKEGRINNSIERAKTEVIEQVNDIPEDSSPQDIDMRGCDMRGRGQLVVDAINLLSVYRIYLYTLPTLFQNASQRLLRTKHQVESLRRLRVKRNELPPSG